MDKIVITGASGYIGSCLSVFIGKKYKVINLDKKSNKLSKVKICNLLDYEKLSKILKNEKPDIVIHLAAQSLVDETINKEKYVLNNVIATKNLIKAMKVNKLNNLIFASTAAVYKDKNKPLKENNKVNPISTYAKTKFKCEQIIKNSNINAIILRFFNVCSSLVYNNNLIGEYHNPETHLIPTVVYKNLFKKKFYIYGNNYNTKDGTCVRDYVHIKDICNAINLATDKIYRLKNNKFNVINIGSSQRKTNLEILNCIENITNIKNQFTMVRRRKGDVDFLVCSNSKAKRFLNWRPKFSQIDNIIKDEIMWIKKLVKSRKFRKFKNYF
tara:strand:+ start:115 stop:1095 length:981 start_codon:yes stop_codon:yes gene_type:complete